MARQRGSGSLFQDAQGYWIGRIELPPGPNGERRRRVVRLKSKAAVQTRILQARAELAKSGDLPTGSPTLGQWLPTWLERLNVKPRTAAGYRTYITQHITPTIGRYRLGQLTPAHVARLHDSMATKGLSSTSALQAHRILSKALNDALRQGLVTRNVAQLVDAPRRAVAVRPSLTTEQARALLVSAAGDDLNAASWAVALLAGLRQGERLGLTIDQLDLDNGILTVAWQLQRLTWQHGCGTKAGEAWPCGKQRAGACPESKTPTKAGQEAKQIHGGLWLTRPKSRAGWRQVPLAPELVTILRAYLAAHPPSPDGFVFHVDGKPIDPRKDAEAWHASLEAAGLPAVPLHSARHTTATLLFSLGVPEDIRVRVLGHSSATVTRGYTHVTNELAADAMDKLGRLLLTE